METSKAALLLAAIVCTTGKNTCKTLLLVFPQSAEIRNAFCPRWVQFYLFGWKIWEYDFGDLLVPTTVDIVVNKKGFFFWFWIQFSNMIYFKTFKYLLFFLWLLCNCDFFSTLVKMKKIKFIPFKNVIAPPSPIFFNSDSTGNICSPNEFFKNYNFQYFFLKMPYF